MFSLSHRPTLPFLNFWIRQLASQYVILTIFYALLLCCIQGSTDFYFKR